MLDELAKKRKDDPLTYGKVCLTIDAMAIRKQISFDSSHKRMIGFVDLGDGPAEDTVASEALVFMVVGLRGHWKTPIGYFFTNTLKPDTQKVLLEHALNALHERGIEVVCLTMDGHASNISMATMLGCQLKLQQPLKTFFNHPSSCKPVYVLFDACHMLKLVRNMFQAYGSFKSPSGAVNWHYLKALSSLQEKEGLHAANKLSSKHIHFQNQKMKVSLAAQTLSSSVALALTMLHDAGLDDFKDCLPTVEFIQVLQFK